MATTDVVGVVIEIVDQTKDDLAEIRANLEAIGVKDLNVDLDINAASDITKTEAQLQALTRTRTAHIRSKMTPGISGVGRMGHMMGDAPQVDELAEMLTPSVGGGGGGGPGGVRGFIQGIDKPLDNAKRQLRGVRRILGAITPNIMDLWNAMAALIPVMISLGAAAIGLAGAFITLGVAAAAIGGIGLLGWGDSFSSSISNAQSRAQKLGETLFDVMQPVANTFQPILEGWMAGAPRQIQRLVGPLERMAIFADTLSAAGAGFIGWLGDALRSMASMERQISQIALRFGDIAGAFIIDFMENMTMFAYENQEAMIQLSHTLRRLLSILLELSLVVSETLLVFSPLIGILEVITALLNTKFGRALLTGIGLFLAAKTAVAALSAAVFILQGGLLKVAAGIAVNYIPAVLGAIGVTDQWIARLGVLRGALLTTGVGALLVGGGLLLNEFIGPDSAGSPSGTGRSGPSTGGTYINIEGDVGRREMDRLLDHSQTRSRDEYNMQEGMNP